MRGSLSGERTRANRLALKWVPSRPAGCPACRGREDTPKVVCFHGDEPPALPTETRCDACGRPIPLRYVKVGYEISMKPADM